MNKKLIASMILCIFFVSVFAAAQEDDSIFGDLDKVPKQKTEKGLIEKGVEAALIKMGLEPETLKKTMAIAKFISWLFSTIEKIWSTLIDAVKVVVNLINSVFSAFPYGKYIALVLTTIIIILANSKLLVFPANLINKIPVLNIALRWQIPLVGFNLIDIIRLNLLPLFFYSVHYRETFADLGDFAMPVTKFVIDAPIPGFFRFLLVYIACYALAHWLNKKLTLKNALLLPFRALGYGWLWGRGKGKTSLVRWLLKKIDKWTGFERRREKRKQETAMVKQSRERLEPLMRDSIALLIRLYHESYLRWSTNPEKIESLRNYERQLVAELSETYKFNLLEVRQYVEMIKFMAATGKDLEEGKK